MTSFVSTEKETFSDDLIMYKAKLLGMSYDSSQNIYEHLKDCIKHILIAQRFDNFGEFETISKLLSTEKRKLTGITTLTTNPGVYAIAKIQQKLFIKSSEEDEEPVPDENEEHPLPNVIENSYYFEISGIGFSEYEMTALNMAIKLLVNSHPFQNARLWGKIFGLLQNYYIVEAEFPEGEDVDDEEKNDDENENGQDNEDQDNEDDRETLPKSKWKPPVKVPREANQTGTNKKVFFVCHEPGLRWTRLPPVTPEQIIAARSIHRYFTGILDSPVACYPPYPGTEANYLRAQIARISASTQISPAGYYHFGGDEEEEEIENEEEGERQRYIKNPDYEPLSTEELADPSLEHWVHHTSYILPQGRVTWWNPVKNLADDFNEFNEDEDEDAGSDRLTTKLSQPERGPPILTPISADLPIFGEKPWTIKMSSEILPEFATAKVSSNLWPGAHCVSWGKKFENIYIGWGLKSSGPGFQPQLQPVEMKECEETPNIVEVKDPTSEEEAALRARLNPPVDENEEEGEENDNPNSKDDDDNDD